ncbi:MlaA family lipoprotein [Roseomonas chloroacetimidivorans]|uniref:MlaA family lipoprotein n=1 Tax=Roseomonas chloroacetimidivorans TaxID=1766656 RepID=UPI003C76F6F1
MTTACATRPPASDPEAVAEFEQINDPLEPTNRALYDVHDAIDTYALRPVAVGYRHVVPPPVRTGIGNALANLRSPVILLNDTLQGEPDRAGTTLGRFLINSTIGLAGFFDVAADMGLLKHDEDFGQTLARWGLDEGPFLFLPILGPTNPRDLAGFGVDVAAQPLNWLGQGDAVDALRWGWAGLAAIDAREGLIEVVDEVKASSLDPYATFRSAYRQRRRALIENRDEHSGPSSGADTRGGAPSP